VAFCGDASLRNGEIAGLDVALVFAASFATSR
jgi:hypothetical protein